FRDGLVPRLGRDFVRVSVQVRPGPGRGAVPRSTQREDLFRVPRDRDLPVAARNPCLVLSPGAPRGLRDRRLGITVRPVGARHPVLDRLRMPAPAAGHSRNGSDHEGGFTMTLMRGTDRLESDRLVLRRVMPGDLPFYT